jgi:hypothetical protein
VDGTRHPYIRQVGDLKLIYDNNDDIFINVTPSRNQNIDASSPPKKNSSIEPRTALGTVFCFCCSNRAKSTCPQAYGITVLECELVKKSS